MAAQISPQPLAVGEIIKKFASDIKEGSHPSYAAVTEYKQTAPTKIELCSVNFDHEHPIIQFTMEDVNSFTIEKGLHQAVVLKFSYGRPDISEVRRIFSSQFDVKGCCNVGQLEFRHLLVRFDLYSDYIHFLSKSIGYIKSKGDEYFFRTFPWSFGFNPKEETSMAVIWISLPGLPLNLFAKRSLMSIASAVRKPLAIDKATQERTRPSATRIKVFVDLLGHDEKSCRFKKQKVGPEEAADYKLVRQKQNDVVKLQGDARDYLNEKKAVQVGNMHKNAVLKKGFSRDNSSLQMLVNEQVKQNGESKTIQSDVSDKANTVMENAVISNVSEDSHAADSGKSKDEVLNLDSRPHTTARDIHDSYVDSNVTVMTSTNHATCNALNGHLPDIAGQSQKEFSTLNVAVAPNIIAGDNEKSDLSSDLVKKSAGEILADVSINDSAGIGLYCKDHTTTAALSGHCSDQNGQSDKLVSRLDSIAESHVLADDNEKSAGQQLREDSVSLNYNTDSNVLRAETAEPMEKQT